MNHTTATALVEKLHLYARLMRLDRPIGIYLLLWPTLWALWVAADGLPGRANFLIFTAGVILMRSAGCVINDFADRHVDKHVERTRDRPITSGAVAPAEAIVLFLLLCLCAFFLVLQTNTQTIYLSFGGVFLAFIYPFMKRYTYLPQVFLGAAFAWAIPMAFTAQTGEILPMAWLLYTATVLWTVAYDTMYAMVDRDDDIRVGIKSTAILFGQGDKWMVGLLQGMTLILWIMVGVQKGYGVWYGLGCIGAGITFLYQQYLIRHRDRDNCFQAFLNNHYTGMFVFAGILLETWPD